MVAQVINFTVADAIREGAAPSWVIVVSHDHAVLFNAAGRSLSPVEILSGWEDPEERLVIRVPVGAEYMFECSEIYLNDAPWFVAGGELTD